jgi:TonB family protein
MPAHGADPAKPDTAAAAQESEPAITVPGVEGDYLRKLHTTIHYRWNHGFLEQVAQLRPSTDPINNMSLSAEVLFTIRWDGSPAEVSLSRSSGVKAFDQAALGVVRGEGGKYPVPPLAAFGDDGVAHFRWVFARNHLLCSEAEVRRREDRLEDALPRLFIQGRVKEALLRVTRYMEEGDTNAMAVFARSWLQRPLPDRAADANAAAALARTGDQRQVSRLRPALFKADTVVIAAQGLAALKVDVCAMVDPVLKVREPESFEIALTALREAKPAPGGPCFATLTAIVDDAAAPKPMRAAALKTLAVLDRDGARKRMFGLLTDPAPELRVAAVTALARPGGGRPLLYKLEPLLKDSSNEVRAAAAAAMIRSCGELSFDYVRPLFKSNDDRPIAAMVAPLGELASPQSIELMEKIEKRANPAVREEIIRALANRKDERGRAMFKPLADAAKKSPYTSIELRNLLLASAPIEELMPLAKDPHLGILAYKAMLRAKRHKEAADWLVTAFDRVSPDVMGEALGAWLADPPTSFASK